MTRKLAWFLGQSVILWLLTALPAYGLWGEQVLMFAAVALALCLVPMLATLVWAHLALADTPENQLLAVFGGTGLRMVLVIVGGILLYEMVEALHHPAFLIWVIVYYLLTLTLEVLAVVGKPPSQAGSQ